MKGVGAFPLVRPAPPPCPDTPDGAYEELCSRQPARVITYGELELWAAPPLWPEATDRSLLSLDGWKAVSQRAVALISWSWGCWVGWCGRPVG
jgi:hypothetical protein